MTAFLEEPMTSHLTAGLSLHTDLAHITRLAANLADAHSCCVFLPHSLIRLLSPASVAGGETGIALAACHSLSEGVLQHCNLSPESGLIGWVAKHNRSIHVSPFERDSRTLGFYSTDQQLKSFIGIPIALPQNSGESLVGVLVCDSKKAFAFSKLQGKLLDDVAQQISRFLELSIRAQSNSVREESYPRFLEQAGHLINTVGINAVEALRIVPNNIYEVENRIGLVATMEMLEQITRLITQALPPHTPLLKLPNSDILVVVDNMMTSFYESRIEAVAEHSAVQGTRLRFQFLRSSRRRNRTGAITVSELIGDTVPTTLSTVSTEGGRARAAQ